MPVAMLCRGHAFRRLVLGCDSGRFLLADGGAEGKSRDVTTGHALRRGSAAPRETRATIPSRGAATDGDGDGFRH